LPSPIEEITNDLCKKKNIKLFIKRDDLINPYISGNKWRKLKEYIEIAQKNNTLGFLSFGGAFSNHLYALAYLGNQLNCTTIGIIRGNELNENSNSYLSQMKTWGMNLYFISREDYKKKIFPSSILNLDQLLIIPEGGYSSVGVSSVSSLAEEIQGSGEYDYIAIAVGTGTTAIGLANACNMPILGILTLNNLSELLSHQKELQMFDDNLIFIEQKEFLKYGKTNEIISEFCHNFYLEKLIKIEPIYTGKMFHRLYDLIAKDYFPSNSKILAIHTGGIK